MQARENLLIEFIAVYFLPISPTISIKNRYMVNNKLDWSLWTV